MGIGVCALLGHADKALDKTRKVVELVQCASIHVQLHFIGVADGVPHAHTMFYGTMLNLAHRSVANAAQWVVDDAADGLIIIGIDSQAEVGYSIFDFLALVERQTAINAIGDGIAHIAVLVTASAIAECLLQRT